MNETLEEYTEEVAPRLKKFRKVKNDGGRAELFHDGVHIKNEGSYTTAEYALIYGKKWIAHYKICAGDKLEIRIFRTEEISLYDITKSSPEQLASKRSSPGEYVRLTSRREFLIWTSNRGDVTPEEEIKSEEDQANG